MPDRAGPDIGGRPRPGRRRRGRVARVRSRARGRGGGDQGAGRADRADRWNHRASVGRSAHQRAAELPRVPAGLPPGWRVRRQRAGAPVCATGRSGPPFDCRSHARGDPRTPASGGRGRRVRTAPARGAAEAKRRMPEERVSRATGLKTGPTSTRVAGTARRPDGSPSASSPRPTSHAPPAPPHPGRSTRGLPIVASVCRDARRSRSRERGAHSSRPSSGPRLEALPRRGQCRATRAGAVPPMTSQDGERGLQRRGGAQLAGDRRVAGQAPAVGVVRARRGRPRSSRPSRSSRPDAAPLRLGDEPADDVVGDPERDAAPDERVGDRGRRRVALARRPAAWPPRRRPACSTMPAITSSDASSVAHASKSGGLSSWRSRW